MKAICDRPTVAIKYFIFATIAMANGHAFEAYTDNTLAWLEDEEVMAIRQTRLIQLVKMACLAMNYDYPTETILAILGEMSDNGEIGIFANDADAYYYLDADQMNSHMTN